MVFENKFYKNLYGSERVASKNSSSPWKPFVNTNGYKLYMDNTVMSQYEPKTAKKIFIYRNGVVNADPKILVVNDRQVRDFAAFLGRVTSSIKAPVAIRSIYTPTGGQRIQSINDLKSGAHYVASGGEQFKKIRYRPAVRFYHRLKTLTVP